MSIMAFHAVPSAPPAVPEGAQRTRTLPHLTSASEESVDCLLHLPELQVMHQE